MNAPIYKDAASIDSAALLARIRAGDAVDEAMALSLADCDLLTDMMTLAAALRDEGFGNTITYSRKVFIPLTHLCRDVCHYCTFAQTPKKVAAPYLAADDVVAQAQAAAKLGCKEALFTLGEKPELRYKAAREALEQMGFATTLDYVAHVAGRVLKETGVIPHINAGCMTPEEITMLRKVSASMGIMLESASTRLCEKGMPHYGSPDKNPAVRLQTIDDAGKASVPFTSGILIGIGETRRERIESLLALRDLHQRHGHLQEIIIQNFRAKPDTLMAQAPEPGLNELLWTIAVARIVFGAGMSIQAPPNLSPGVLPQLVAAGINDWGGVSPVTPDFVNPEAPWPHLKLLADETAVAGKFLDERVTVYPQYVHDAQRWIDAAVRPAVLSHVDGGGLARRDFWLTGSGDELPALELELLQRPAESLQPSSRVRDIVDAALASEGASLDEAALVSLFSARGDDFAYVCKVADQLRRTLAGDVVSYVVNRNINYTNVCYFKCQFCAFSKGKLSENLRGKPYDISPAEIARRALEAWERGATEVCMQGGIHPDYTGETYLSICRTVKDSVPDMHVHAFSPLEVWQGAATLGIDIHEFLARLKVAGLNTLPGTAAEILDDEVRAIICADKINTQQWLQVMRAAHTTGFRTTATIMFGHVESYRHWARHLLRVRGLQAETGGFTEFVPLPFVASEAPMYLKGRSRRGPTLRECLLMHAVARLCFASLIPNIQASWVKLGERGIQAALQCGVNDLGGTLMNESITRAAGATHGEELPPPSMQQLITAMGREPRQRTTLYADAPAAQYQRSFAAPELTAIVNESARRVKVRP
jgi:FO synthase